MTVQLMTFAGQCHIDEPLTGQQLGKGGSNAAQMAVPSHTEFLALVKMTAAGVGRVGGLGDCRGTHLCERERQLRGETLKSSRLTLLMMPMPTISKMNEVYLCWLLLCSVSHYCCIRLLYFFSLFLSLSLLLSLSHSPEMLLSQTAAATVAVVVLHNSITLLQGKSTIREKQTRE